jgi:RNA polymerase sigma-70 factor (ECF subfamily)
MACEANAMAQERLFKKHAPKMLSVCRQYIPELQRAEEAMCNGFLKVFKNLKSYRGEGSFEGWVRRIMVRESISYLRSDDKMYFKDLNKATVISNFNMMESSLEMQDLQRIIDELPPGYRSVFVLYAIEGYKHQEIAEMLNISENTSKTQLFKARKKLKENFIGINSYHNGTHEI